MSKTGHSDSTQPMRVVVIGAGLAGLTAARTLLEGGLAVTVFDKGRGPGGRASSRRKERFSFDHGAQYFTAREERFRGQVDEWLRSGVIAPWRPRLAVFDAEGVRKPRSEHERYVGVPGMNAVAKHLARPLDIRSQVRVGRVERIETAWRIESEAGELLSMADFTLVAVPPAQALPLLTAAPQLAEQVASAVLRPCWATLLAFEEPLSVDFDAAFVNAGPLSWVARNSSKPGRDGGEAWILHASLDWSEQNLERDPVEVTRLLQEEFATRCVGSTLPAIAHADSHRWRYAQPDPALEAPCLFDGEQWIGAAGDWCGGPRIEGAVLSGLAFADRVLGKALSRDSGSMSADSDGPTGS